MKQRLLYRSGLASACLLLAGVMLLLWTQTSAQTSTSDEAAEAALTPRLKQMLQVMKIARARHLLKPENPEMIDGAIRGMLARLDPEAELYTPSQMRRLLVQTVTPRSIGLAVKKQAMPPRNIGPAYRVVSAIDGSPAARAGLRVGDLISRIDGVPTAELLTADLDINRLAGPKPGFVALEVIRGGQTLDFALEREHTRSTAAVSITTLPGGVLLLRIGSFTPGTAHQAQRQLSAQLAVFAGELRAGDDPSRNVRGLVLDLRDAVGGLADEAINVADLFLDAGIITTKESRADKPLTFQARTGDVMAGKPIMLLINAGTASRAEILAAALQDNKRATLIGTATAGLGGNPSFVPLGGERGWVFLKTERYLSPAGRPLDKAGIKPDIEIKVAQGDAVSACREVDRPDEDGDGRCERRPVTEDPVLQAALAHLSGQPVTVAKP